MVGLKKNTAAVLILIVFLSSLTGCGNIVNLSEEEQDVVAEYAAQAVLKHDKNYKSKLEKVTSAKTETSAEISGETETASDEKIIKENVSDDHEDETEVSYSDAFGFSPVSIAYTGFEICESYPAEGDMTFRLNAAENTHLLVLKFNVSNNTGSPKDVNMMSAGIHIKLDVNEESKYSALVTLLLNGLNTYSGTLADGENKELVLVFQVPYEDENSISELVMNVSGNTSSASFKLK